MQSRYVKGITIRPLRNGDTQTVAALFDRLGEGSREKRFCGGKRRLSDPELASLARVNGAAEVAFEVADEYQGRGVGSTLVRELAADARAVGISEFVAMVCRDNPGAVALLKQVAKSLQVTWRGREREFVVGLET